MSAREEDYKAVGAAAGLAYNQKVGAESAVDINLAKQLNVVMTQLGVSADSIVMNVGSAAVGYGYEYVVSTLDRIKAAALSQDDKMLQMPIITPIASETWNVKEAMATEEESPEWEIRKYEESLWRFRQQPHLWLLVLMQLSSNIHSLLQPFPNDSGTDVIST